MIQKLDTDADLVHLASLGMESPASLLTDVQKILAGEEYSVLISKQTLVIYVVPAHQAFLEMVHIVKILMRYHIEV